jgi:hypothetical protein
MSFYLNDVTRLGNLPGQLETQQSYLADIKDLEDRKTYTFANSKYPIKQHLN